MTKIQTHHYSLISLKYKKLNMQIGNLFSKKWKTIFFVIRLFLVGDTKFKSNQKKKKIRRIQNFRLRFI
jgi:hypothetical protein